jgi:uncharacterized membrane protein
MGDESGVEPAAETVFNAAEIGAVAHLYRAEVYRSTVWRTRLDATTNWAVVANGIALSVAFSHNDASPLPLAIVGLLVAVFLVIEARRYRFFDFWRVRAHVMELHFYGPILRGEGAHARNGWNRVLNDDYRHPHLHISLLESVGRRLRRNYGWIFGIQVVAYVGKLLIHPVPIGSLEEFWARAAVGPIPGQLVLLAGLAFHGTWITVAVLTARGRRGGRKARHDNAPRRDPTYEFLAGGG